MHKGKNHITKSEDYQRYLDGSMTSKERHAFEKRMLEDEFESEALEGLSEVEPSALIKDFTNLSKRIQVKPERSSAFIYWRIAASLLILTVFSFVVYFMIDIDTTSEIAQSKQDPLSEKPAISQEEKELLSESSIEEPESVITYLPKEDKMKEEIASADRTRTSGKKEQILSKEEDVGLELDLDETYDELLLEESTDDIEVARSIEDPVQNEPKSLSLVTSGAPDKIDLQPLEVEDEAAKEEISVSKPLTGRVAGVNVQSSRKSQYKKASNIEGIKTITGNVYSSEDDEVLPGVNVIAKGSNQRTVTDIEGNYQIEVPENEDVILVFSYIGFNSKEIEVSNQEIIDVNIEPDLTALSEIVVVGYGVSQGDAEQSYSYVPPKPEGGKGKFRDYIMENIKYPPSAIEDQKKGTVKLIFKVEINGEIRNMEVMKSLGEDFDEEAIRLVEEGPGWKPAIENDSVVVRDVKVKIRFRPPK